MCIRDRNNTTHFVLRETETPAGYRTLGDVRLYYEKDSGLILSDGYWNTGAYGMPKVTTSAPATIDYADGSDKKLDLAAMDTDDLKELNRCV